MMEVIDLLVILAKQYKDRCGLAPAKTKLIKLAYLAEIYYKRLSKQRLTNQTWVFWKYGPYFMEFDEMISNEKYFSKPERTDDFYPIEVQEEIEFIEPKIDEKIAISRALDHAVDDLDQILDFVYFDTEPMIKARTRGEILDFDAVLSEEYYRIKQYKVERNQGREITEKIKEWEKRIKRGH